MKKVSVYLLLMVLLVLLSGCVFSAVDEMYRLPERSEEYRALQQVIDGAMVELNYSAPISGQQR